MPCSELIFAKQFLGEPCRTQHKYRIGAHHGTAHCFVPSCLTQKFSVKNKKQNALKYKSLAKTFPVCNKQWWQGVPLSLVTYFIFQWLNPENGKPLFTHWGGGGGCERYELMNSVIIGGNIGLSSLWHQDFVENIFKMSTQHVVWCLHVITKPHSFHTD